MAFEIERVAGLDLELVAPLIEESEAAGFHFLAWLRDDWQSGANRFDRPGEAFFVARVDGVLAGVCGLNRNPFGAGGDEGRVRRLYVAESFRRAGVGRALLQAVCAAATGHFRDLTVRAPHPDAARFYESLGFVPVDEPHNTHRLPLSGGRP